MNDHSKYLDKRLRRLERKNDRLEMQNALLREENRLLRLQLKEFQQQFFKKKKSKKDDPDDSPAGCTPKKRGAPMGHPGTTRKIPDHFDDHVDVTLLECPHCGGTHLKKCKRIEDHYQEDIVLPQVKVTRFRHYYYYCKGCKDVVCGVGQGELPGSYIGPVAKSLAAFLRYQMKVPYDKVSLLFRELFHLSFNPSSGPGFDRQIRIRGAPLYEKMRSSIVRQPFVHVDETGWRNEGINHWLWCFISPEMAVYHIDRSRGSKVVAAMFGKRYSGTLISDFLGAYNRLKSRKQRCLVHLLRLVKKWQLYFAVDTRISKRFAILKRLVKSMLRLNQQMAIKRPRNFINRRADLIAQLRRLLQTAVRHPKAEKFFRKLDDRIDELIMCLYYPYVPAHNNLAERCLRDNVIMRKITFGNRSFYGSGQQNHQVLMSLIQTARLQNLNPLSFLHSLLIKPDAASTAIRIPFSSTR